MISGNRAKCGYLVFTHKKGVNKAAIVFYMHDQHCVDFSSGIYLLFVTSCCSGRQVVTLMNKQTSADRKIFKRFVRQHFLTTKKISNTKKLLVVIINFKILYGVTKYLIFQIYLIFRKLLQSALGRYIICMYSNIIRNIKGARPLNRESLCTNVEHDKALDRHDLDPHQGQLLL